MSKLAMVSLILVMALSARADAGQLTLQLEPLGENTWRVDYAFSLPVDSLVFARGNGDYRTGTWLLDDEAFVLERFGNTDRIRRRDGEAFDHVSARLSAHGEKPSKDYTPFLKFSDGSVAVFTGQFVVGEPATDDAGAFVDGANEDNTVFPDGVELTVSPGLFKHMIVDASVVDEPAQLQLGEGEYLYFGGTAAIETPALTAVIDPATPAWLREHLNDSMALTFQYYDQRLGSLGGEKPFMLVSFQQLEGGRLSFNGGVIGSQLAISLGLGDAIQDSPGERQFMARFFAHESAHLWNNGRVVAAEDKEAWMHEGSAEAMAWLALGELGLIDTDAVEELFHQAADACAGFLDDGPLREAGRRDAFRAYYDCGATIAFATHNMMRAEGEDLFDFWRELIDSAESRGGLYRAADYRLIVAARSPALAEQIRRITEVTVDDGAAAVAQLLISAGVDAD